MSARRPLPPLEIGQAYLATALDSMSFVRDLSAGVKPTLRFRLAGGVTIDFEPSDAELRALAQLLARVYPAAT